MAQIRCIRRQRQPYLQHRLQLDHDQQQASHERRQPQAGAVHPSTLVTVQQWLEQVGQEQQPGHAARHFQHLIQPVDAAGAGIGVIRGAQGPEQIDQHRRQQQAAAQATAPTGQQQQKQNQPAEGSDAITHGSDEVHGDGLAGALAPEDGVRGLQQHQYIKKKAVVLDVVQIVLQLFIGILIRGAVGVADLCPAGDARIDQVAH